MKIYHKKNFTFGLFALFLAALNLVLNLQQGFNWKDGALIALLCLLGAASLIRSLSQKYSHTDKVEELDSKNRSFSGGGTGQYGKAGIRYWR